DVFTSMATSAYRTHPSCSVLEPLAKSEKEFGSKSTNRSAPHQLGDRLEAWLVYFAPIHGRVRIDHCIDARVLPRRYGAKGGDPPHRPPHGGDHRGELGRVADQRP